MADVVMNEQRREFLKVSGHSADFTSKSGGAHVAVQTLCR